MEKKKGFDYSTLHKLDSPANRLIRKSIWRDQDIGQQSFITPWYLDINPKGRTRGSDRWVTQVKKVVNEKINTRSVTNTTL